mmetsp:Transcript_14117/g.30553  ORF Transcript_14117/g.30553 Transcript_14117/m.30553 type:complete len:768 (-) Transcript_14117:41-2344(-)
MADAESATTTADPSEGAEGAATSSEQIRNAVIMYGGIFCVLFLIFLLARNRFKLTYNPRNSVPRLNSKLAAREYGLLGWIPGVLRITSDELYDCAGMDAVVLVRSLQMGFKIAVVGCLNAFYLIPVYAGAPDAAASADGLSRWEIGHLPDGDARIWAAVPATYILFIYAMYLVHAEFRWYTAKRHEHLSRATPENYTVVLGNLPPELRSCRAITKHFAGMFPGKVVEAQAVLDLSDLEGRVAERDALVVRLEHACEVLAATGSRPQHKVGVLGCCGEKVDSITQLRERLRELDKDVSAVVAKVHAEEELESRNSQESKRARPGGFVSFSSLLPVMALLQMVQHGRPGQLSSSPGCQPKDVQWANLGLTHRRRQLGRWLSFVLTAVMCLFWTIPVAFVSSLSKVSALKQRLTFLEDAGDAPWLNQLLALVQPLALAALVSLQPIILEFFSTLEGHVSLAAIKASLFAKLSVFMIVQIFFISAISGSLFAQLERLITEPWSAVQDMLSTSLPGQATTFIVYVLVQTFLGLGMELLRPYYIGMAWARSKFGPTLTEKERSSVWMGLRPLCDPGPLLKFELLLAHIVFMFMVLMVYAVLSPVTSFFMTLSFGLMVLTYSNQFVYVYEEETFGQYWPTAIRWVIACMFVALLTVTVVLAFNEGAVQAILMVPLLVAVLLFWVYVEAEHFRTAEFLPAADCVRVDQQRREEGEPFDFLRGVFRQRALKNEASEPLVAELLKEEEENAGDGAAAGSDHERGMAAGVALDHIREL